MEREPLPIRQVIDDAPASIPVPETLRHRRVELILWPLDSAPDDSTGSARQVLEQLAAEDPEGRPTTSAREVEDRINALREEWQGRP